MDDLETRKLKRDWTAVNWTGESSSLSGTDAIAWPRLGQDLDPITLLSKTERLRFSIGEQHQLTESRKKQFKDEQELFYRRLSWVLDAPEQRKGKAHKMLLEKLRDYEEDKKDNHEDIGRYIAVNERLSIPELVKRLITYDKIDEKEPDDQKLKIPRLKKHKDDPEFKDIYREAGYWTGWFMGDGDRVGDKLKQLAETNVGNLQKQEQGLLKFSELMRGWGRDFESRKDLFPGGKGRVIYAGGDDFMGVLYSEETQTKEAPEKLKAIEAWNWLLQLPEQWKNLQNDLAEELNFKDENRFTYSVGFVWVGHGVPQRDILQHCREAEKRAKSLGRDRVTIRVVFNSGQYVQWTCPWDYLDILTKYRDRNHQDRSGSPEDQNWTHIYNDWATLKARHAIRLEDQSDQVDDRIALKVFELYFDDMERFEQHSQEIFKDNYTPKEVIKWLDDLVNVGWQLCSNS
jgi:CRISPR-associated protein Cmr2